MLQLKNIEISKDRAEADFYPENEQRSGHVVVDLEKEEIIELRNVSGFEFMYPAHALRELIRMAREGDKRKTCTVMWY